MEASFWHRTWEKNEIGFHQSEVNPFLVKYFDKLALPAGSRVFLPLCGKTLDIDWLLAQGFHVVGVELNPGAVEQLFEQLRLVPEKSVVGDLMLYAADRIDIFVGDIFDLSSDQLDPVDAVYDRAALVAMPEDMRIQYTDHLAAITHCAPQLLITFEYDQSKLNGPPFSISEAEIHRHYSGSFNVTLLRSENLPNRLKGQVEANENAWLLR